MQTICERYTYITYTHAHTHVNKHTHIYTYVFTYIHAHTHAHTHAYTHIHRTLCSNFFFPKHKIVELRQPPYSPDIAPCDFWLFPN